MFDDEYLTTQVMTAAPYELHLLVVDGAILHAKKALNAFETEDYEVAHHSLNASRDFVGELISGLDATRSPDLVENLHGLFSFVFINLANADMHREPQRVHDALRVLELHRETWFELTQQLKADGVPEQTVAGQNSWTT